MRTILAALLLLILATSAASAQQCLHRPDLRDHRGYWRYHVDHRTGAHCWYQAGQRAKVRVAYGTHRGTRRPVKYHERPWPQGTMDSQLARATTGSAHAHASAVDIPTMAKAPVARVAEGHDAMVQPRNDALALWLGTIVRVLAPRPVRE